MAIDIDQLSKICTMASRARLLKFIEPLNEAMEEFSINTLLRQAAFIAQVAHESGSFFYMRELASGKAYEGRADLGNIEPGDGEKFKGRGLIQITGRANYQECGDALGVNLLLNPDLLEEPELACRSAGWFWATRNLNQLADGGDMKHITRRINGGLNGYNDRLAYYDRAMKVLHA